MKGPHLGGLTHDVIAKRLGMSRRRVQDIENRALDKMRAAAAADGMDEDDFRELCALFACGAEARRGQ